MMNIYFKEPVKNLYVNTDVRMIGIYLKAVYEMCNTIRMIYIKYCIVV